MEKLPRSLNIAVFVILFFTGCAQQRFEASTFNPGDEAVEDRREIVRLLLQELDSKSRLNNQNTIYVSYSMNSESYKGVPIETRHYRFFLGETSQFTEFSQDYGVLRFSQQEEIFATVRFFHGSHYTAYLLRAPSAYDSSAIDLRIYDRKNKVWLDPIRVADEEMQVGILYLQDGLQTSMGTGSETLFREGVIRMNSEKRSLILLRCECGRMGDSCQQKCRRIVNSYRPMTFLTGKPGTWKVWIVEHLTIEDV